MTDNYPLDPPVFPMFVGCWRSGTTLLRSMFDSHRDFAVAHETNFIPAAIDRYRMRPFKWADYLITLASSRRYPGWGPSTSSLEQAAQAEEPRDLATAVRLTFRTYAAAHGKPLYGDKTPSHLPRLGDIATLLPETRFIHLIRDGRDVALALVAANFGPNSIEEAALHWRSRVTAGRAFGEVVGPERYLEIKYETLVEAPAATAKVICTFLGADYDKGVLDHRRSASDLMVRAVNPGVHGTLAKPILRGVRDWRQEMGEREVLRFEAIGGRLLNELGYEVTVPSRPVGVQAESLVRRGFVELMRVNRKRRGLSSAKWW